MTLHGALDFKVKFNCFPFELKTVVNLPLTLLPELFGTRSTPSRLELLSLLPPLLLLG